MLGVVAQRGGQKEAITDVLEMREVQSAEPRQRCGNLQQL